MINPRLKKPIPWYDIDGKTLKTVFYRLIRIIKYRHIEGVVWAFDRKHPSALIGDSRIRDLDGVRWDPHAPHFGDIIKVNDVHITNTVFGANGFICLNYSTGVIFPYFVDGDSDETWEIQEYRMKYNPRIKPQSAVTRTVVYGNLRLAKHIGISRKLKLAMESPDGLSKYGFGPQQRLKKETYQLVLNSPF